MKKHKPGHSLNSAIKDVNNFPQVAALTIAGLGLYLIVKSSVPAKSEGDTSTGKQEQKLQNDPKTPGKSSATAIASRLRNAMNPSGDSDLINADGTDEDAMYKAAWDAYGQWDEVVKAYAKLYVDGAGVWSNLNSSNQTLLKQVEEELNSTEYQKFLDSLNHKWNPYTNEPPLKTWMKQQIGKKVKFLKPVQTYYDAFLTKKANVLPAGDYGKITQGAYFLSAQKLATASFKAEKTGNHWFKYSGYNDTRLSGLNGTKRKPINSNNIYELI
jgi:hypothetical protein